MSIKFNLYMSDVNEQSEIKVARFDHLFTVFLDRSITYGLVFRQSGVSWTTSVQFQKGAGTLSGCSPLAILLGTEPVSLSTWPFCLALSQ